MRDHLKPGGLVALALLMPACKTATPEGDAAMKPAPPMVGEGDAEFMESVRSAMDTTADPCQDFYQYACGGWLETAEIPADKVTWGRTFDEIWERNRAKLRTLIEEEAKAGADTDPGLKQISDYYAACSDTETIDSLGVAPLKPWLEKIKGVKDLKGLMPVLADLQKVDVDALFGIYVTPDYKNPDVYTLAIVQGGLGLPDRDYYLDDDPKMAGIRDAYQAHIARMLTYLGPDVIKSDADAAARAAKIMAFETQLAQRAVPRTEMRDAEKRYNPMATADLLKGLQPLPFKGYLAAINAQDVEVVVNATPTFFEGYGAFLKGTDIKVLKDYLRWQLLVASASLLPEAVDMAHFEFYGKTLRGQEEQQPRWKRCVTKTSFDLKDPVGRSFVEREFAGDSKETALEMIHGIEAAFAAGLPELAWMDEATQARALEKAQAVTNKIGYPDTWLDYGQIPVTSSDYFNNVLAVRAFESDRWLARIGGEVDRDEWFMPTFMVNAYYNPSGNEMVFPAGILQPPFFDADYPMSMNLGAIGMVMGHELTHGFDDQGRKFDGTGRLIEWWAPEVSARFEEAAQCVVDSYSAYEVQEGLMLNGELTLGENIADLGGLKQSYRAHRAWVESQGAPMGLGGMSADQLFFTSFAQSWCSKARPEVEEVLVRTDSHSVPRYRVIGALSNFPDFGEAFQCAEGTPMRPAKVCQVW